ncbi:isopentenyl phosphate kinase family protein [Candidatus Beckwithbacteria bacterium]|nr:isopentenyl phosphate kinase family protein [Candidatus Beckwithbacteria bacterium]
MKPIIFIKIGGSLITDKLKERTLKEEALEIICREIKLAMNSGKQLIIGHGAGSFGHFPATKYQTHKGILNDQSYKGIAEVADVACELNRIVVKKLIDIDVNAVSFSPFSMITSQNFELKTFCTESLEQALKLNLLPVLYGDQILDTEKGCTIFSTEKVLGYLALHLQNKGYNIERIIHCGQTNGVYDEQGETIELINTENFAQYKKVLGGSGGIDVTGGMIHKVEETLELARQGIPGLIIDGIEHGSLSKAIKGEKIIGTRIEK